MPFSELSMGMSRDYQKQLLGSTYVRIGTAFLNRKEICH